MLAFANVRAYRYSVVLAVQLCGSSANCAPAEPASWHAILVDLLRYANNLFVVHVSRCENVRHRSHGNGSHKFGLLANLHDTSMVQLHIINYLSQDLLAEPGVGSSILKCWFVRDAGSALIW
jgi:hypothetical protein